MKMITNLFWGLPVKPKGKVTKVGFFGVSKQK